MLKKIPEYPYPIKPTFKQAWFGLYGGKHIQFGNNVPDSRYKTRRYWMPNIRNKKLYSRALKSWIQLTVATSVLRMSRLEGKGGEGWVYYAEAD